MSGGISRGAKLPGASATSHETAKKRGQGVSCLCRTVSRGPDRSLNHLSQLSVREAVGGPEHSAAVGCNPKQDSLCPPCLSSLNTERTEHLRELCVETLGRADRWPQRHGQAVPATRPDETK